MHSQEAEVGQRTDHLGQAAVVSKTFPATPSDPVVAAIGLDPVDIRRFHHERLARGHPHQHAILDLLHAAIVARAADFLWLIAVQGTQRIGRDRHHPNRAVSILGGSGSSTVLMLQQSRWPASADFIRPASWRKRYFILIFLEPLQRRLI
jgi:acyl-coenzyme A thioesterase PaaI-like protein